MAVDGTPLGCHMVVCRDSASRARIQLEYGARALRERADYGHAPRSAFQRGISGRSEGSLVAGDEHDDLVMIQRVFRWRMGAPEEPVVASDVVVWWERRRLAYNVLVAAAGLISFAIYWVSIAGAGVVKPGE